ncbi:zinc finger and BTB domain-containing protein 24-like isoform X2 [Micropterus salmoides]|uniref:zinc finger and BTB domain-containing protein 24-like isoform X2 n=1 Tax=Micropterus salmoides TaxID=27706 RepID=UPI0018EE06CF|nr:zinc finger and BTB domain-containing protein 24-like isoform X2 [Micropterus salmoides]
MCSVVGCESGRRGAQRFKLPEDPERRLEWVQFLFEVNGQRLKESCWTDITICREHFTDGCFVNASLTGTVQLKCSAVPSLCIKSEHEEPCQEEVKTEAAFQCDQLKTCNSPSTYFEESGRTSVAAPESPVPSDTSDVSMPDYGQMLQNVVNIDMIREKAALLQMKGKYVVNESQLLQLFGRKCPLCGSKVKVEKVTCGVLLILNQQCLQCEYRNQWKSQVNASVPTAEDQHLTGGIDVTLETQTVSTDHDHSTITRVSDVAAATNEESDPMCETEESGDEGDSDEDWNPVELSSGNELLNDESDEEESDYEGDYSYFATHHRELCTDCGMFFSKRWPHTCEHKSKPYPCNICGKRCVSEVALNSHSRIHDANYEHQCKYCHVTFKTKVDKITHQQIHLTEGKPYKCPDCSETFASNKDRRIHLVDHRGPQQLKCDICGIEFNRHGPLKRHLSVHTGVKPFKCSVCKRGFNQASHLKSHMRLHTGERPYKCQHCDKSFNHNVSLKSHVQRYHTPGSGCARKRGKKKKTVGDTVDAQENENQKGTNSGHDNVDEEHDEEETVQKERTNMPKKKKRRSTGRPIGRPKRNAESQRSKTMTAKVKGRKLKRTHYSVEESEDEPTASEISFDPTEEEEERSDKATSNTSRSRGRAKVSDMDSDSDPKDPKKKRYSSQSSEKSSETRRGRPRQNQVVEDI